MVVKYKQENGLTVLFEPIPDVVSVSVGMWVKKGSRDEDIYQYGYAHFVEHMLFKGTEKYSAADIARKIDRVGGQHNAATNREYTCYYINVVSDYLELAVEILSDMYYNSVFEPAEIIKEKNVIIEEIRMYEDTPDEFIHDFFMEKMFQGHPLSHSILGPVEGIEQISHSSLMKFYEENYINENIIVAIAGSFDPNSAKSLLSSYFKRTRSSSVPADIIIPSSPSRIDREHLQKDLEQIHFCMGVEGIRRNDHDRWGLYILSTILGGSMSSRLFQNIREKEGISYSIYSFHSSYIDCGIFGIYCATVPDKYAKTVDLIMNECRKLFYDGISDEEFLDSKTFMKGNLALSLENNEIRMSQLARNEMTYGRNYDFNDIAAIIDSITIDDYLRVCEKIFKGKSFSLVSVGNLKKISIKNFNLTI